jgi:hypothetical protein
MAENPAAYSDYAYLLLELLVWGTLDLFLMVAMRAFAPVTACALLAIFYEMACVVFHTALRMVWAAARFCIRVLLSPWRGVRRGVRVLWVWGVFLSGFFGVVGNFSDRLGRRHWRTRSSLNW